MAVQVHESGLLLVRDIDEDLLPEDRQGPVGSEGDGHRLRPVRFHRARRRSERERGRPRVIRVGRHDGLQGVLELELAVVSDHQLLRRLILPVLAVRHRTELEHAVRGLDLEDGPHTTATERHLKLRALSSDLQVGLVDLHELRVELNHELEGLIGDGPRGAQHREAAALGQRIQPQLLRLHAHLCLKGQRQDLALLRRDLPEVENWRSSGQDRR
mmetsp:Transcript_23511/g.79715  ORF Transcript_23511/g.79715 Transcript_23511/m.79715 type:complete len:215 (+) Transcript_23511:687-1331(+)